MPSSITAAVDRSNISSDDQRPSERGKKRLLLRSITQQVDKILLVIETKFGERMLSNREVAKTLGLTLEAVSALLKAAYDQGYFKVVLCRPGETAELAGLEHAVKTKFGLKRVLLVPGLTEILDVRDPKQRIALHSGIMRAMAVRVGGFLDEFVQATANQQRKDELSGRQVKPALVGVAWGRTLHMIAEHLLSLPRPVRAFRGGLEFVPLIGITNGRNPEGVEANVVASDIARAYGGVSTQLPCPAFADKVEKVTLRGMEQVNRVMRLLPECRLIVTAMGPILPEGPDSDMTLSSDRAMSARLAASARKARAFGEIMFGLFDAHGREVHTEWHVMSIGLQGIQRIAKDPGRDAVLVCGGDRRRFEPLRVALQAGLASVLVSDTVTARYLLGRL